jgi:hypothetical protein
MAGRVVSTQRPRWSQHRPPIRRSRSSARRAVVAVINSLRILGGFVARYAVGALVNRTGQREGPGRSCWPRVLTVTAAATFLYGGRPGAHHTSARARRWADGQLVYSSSTESTIAAAEALARSHADGPRAQLDRARSSA